VILAIRLPLNSAISSQIALCFARNSIIFLANQKITFHGLTELANRIAEKYKEKVILGGRYRINSTAYSFKSRQGSPCG